MISWSTIRWVLRQSHPSFLPQNNGISLSDCLPFVSTVGLWFLKLAVIILLLLSNPPDLLCTFFLLCHVPYNPCWPPPPEMYQLPSLSAAPVSDMIHRCLSHVKLCPFASELVLCWHRGGHWGTTGGPWREWQRDKSYPITPQENPIPSLVIWEEGRGNILRGRGQGREEAFGVTSGGSACSLSVIGHQSPAGEHHPDNTRTLPSLSPVF